MKIYATITVDSNTFAIAYEGMTQDAITGLIEQTWPGATVAFVTDEEYTAWVAAHAPQRA